MAKEKATSFVIPAETIDRVRATGVNQSRLVRYLLERWLEDPVTPPEPPPPQRLIDYQRELRAKREAK